MSDVNHGKDARAGRLLALGATLGLVVASATLLRAPGDEAVALGDSVVARVNGAPIRREAYTRLVAALAADKRTPLDEEDRRRVLDRLIEEELLVQHAVDLGLLRTDRRVRADLVSAVLSALVASADAVEPTDAEIEEFYRSENAYFRVPPRLQVRRVFVSIGAAGSDAAARDRAERAARRLRSGEPIEVVVRELGSPVVAPIPDALLPESKLREYVGPEVMDRVAQLEPGEVGDPMSTPQGYHVVQLVARRDGETAPLAEISEQVRAELKRRAGDRALRERLDALREQADVQVVGSLP